YLLDDAALEDSLTETGPEPHRILRLDGTRSATITPTALAALIREASPLIVDVGDSADYVHAHVPGARWCLRSTLASIASGSRLVLTSSDGVMARLAAPRLTDLGREGVLALDRRPARGRPRSRGRAVPSPLAATRFMARLVRAPGGPAGQHHGVSRVGNIAPGRHRARRLRAVPQSPVGRARRASAEPADGARHA